MEVYTASSLGNTSAGVDGLHGGPQTQAVCVDPGAIWHHADGDRQDASSICLFPAADCDVFMAAFHHSFLHGANVKPSRNPPHTPEH